MTYSDLRKLMITWNIEKLMDCQICKKKRYAKKKSRKRMCSLSNKLQIKIYIKLSKEFWFSMADEVHAQE